MQPCDTKHLDPRRGIGPEVAAPQSASSTPPECKLKWEELEARTDIATEQASSFNQGAIAFRAPQSRCAKGSYRNGHAGGAPSVERGPAQNA